MGQRIQIVGAGLAGTLAGIYLAQRGYEVNIFEKRGDMRATTIEGGRSINLALSKRGLRALEEVGIREDVMALALPMRGRMIHDREGRQTMQPYGQSDDEIIYSVSRAGLNMKLMNKAEQTGRVTFFFQHPCHNIDFEKGEITYGHPGGTEITESTVGILGCDGANSAVRMSMQKSTRLNYQQQYLEHGYKELSVPPDEDGSHKLSPDALHIWPRGSYMMIALPNPDGTFTCTLFLAYDGAPSFNQLRSKSDVRAFFQANFADLIPLMPRYEEEFFENPTSSLVTLRCSPWTKGSALLLGDSAHAIVPFYGQGMNACFEDCRLLNAALAEHEDEWVAAIKAFGSARKPDADAIADLALDNFVEMRDSTADPIFARKRELELQLEEAYPDRFFSKYRLVTFSHLPYHVARDRGRAQDSFLMDLVRPVEDVSELDLADVMERVEAALGPVPSEKELV
jgi:kynurenine 3-monooxygenase